jgi:hypothetical protein
MLQAEGMSKGPVNLEPKRMAKRRPLDRGGAHLTWGVSRRVSVYEGGKTEQRSRTGTLLVRMYKGQAGGKGGHATLYAHSVYAQLRLTM